MKATVFHAKNDIRIEEVAKPRAGAGEAIIRVTLTTICGTDLHIVRGEYPVAPGLVIGHEPVGVCLALGVHRTILVQSRLAVNVMRVYQTTCRNAVMAKVMRRWADGASETPSTERRLNI